MKKLTLFADEAWPIEWITRDGEVVARQTIVAPTRCCRGINTSHELSCPDHKLDETVVCWCCMKTIPVDRSTLWSENGCRCYACEKHEEPCAETATQKPVWE